MQNTNQLLMIRPYNFYMNPQTAVNNYFQKKSTKSINDLAIQEFDKMVDKLKYHGVNVIIYQDTETPNTPDSIFPNNWISFHEDGTIALYPMYAENRRLERDDNIIEEIEKLGFEIKEIVDYSDAENQNIYLEGTGSIILDRENKIAYASISERTDPFLFEEFCIDFEYKPIVFHSYQTVNNTRLPIYHTNVMMCVADQFVVICLDAVDDPKEKEVLKNIFKKTNKKVIKITEEQMHQFAGNMLQVLGKNNQPNLVMSQQAYNSLSASQIESIEAFCPIISVDISTIENAGGGSARCMMAEVFLPKSE